MSKPKQEFIELITTNSMIKGLDELSSKIIAYLYIEPKELSLESIANKTGYSLSAVSTAMKQLVRFGFVTRIKKPKSKKVYFYMEKNMLNKHLEMMKKQYDQLIQPSKQKLPSIIKEYKKLNAKEETKIVESYLNQILVWEKLMKNIIKQLEKC